jgi:Peroxiredoxin
MSDLTPGAPAPDFKLQGPSGPIRLADFAGKPLVVYFYPKDDTTGCTKEAQDFTALAPEFEKGRRRSPGRLQGQPRQPRQRSPPSTTSPCPWLQIPRDA